MASGNNDKLVLESIRSISKIQPNDSTENINVDDKNSNYSNRCLITSVLDVTNHALIVIMTVYLIYNTLKAKYTVTSIHLILCTIGVSIPFS